MDFFLYFLVIFSIGYTPVFGQDYRLPGNTLPSKYEVALNIPEGVFTGETRYFEGQVTIHFAANTSGVTEIKLHHRVNITTETLINESGETIDTSSDYNSTNEIYTLTVSEALTEGATYQLTFVYNASFETTAMRGFYISDYKDENGETAYLVTTQFQPVSARHGFPCWDEPEYKATFAINLTHPTGLTALSNSEAIYTEEAGTNYTKTIYNETTKMSTYLIAFIISKFNCTAGDTIDSNVYHQVCSREEETANRAWALEVGTPLLRTLESMMGLKYGAYMPKMHQVAIPDFSAGAMENWGLVTYRETGILFSEEDTSNSYKKSIALVIAHEFTHMWFGNLVTCKWWDYTFLNEGFARFYQYFASAVTKQMIDWELDKHFNVEQLHTALLADSVESAQALTSTATSSSGVSGKFSTISYNKGASIFRMIELNIMGADKFIYGLRDYLYENQLSATVPADLWTSLAKFVPSNALPTDVDLSSVLYNWIEESGHPVVKVSQSGDDVILTQERFFLNNNNNTARQYYVPITYTVSNDITKFSNTTGKTWLVPNNELILSGVLSNSTWIILNNRQSGFYRVDYDNALWTAIYEQLHSNHLEIDVLNRAQLVSDAYNFARAGRSSGYGNWTFKELMNVLSYLKYEVDYYPWYAAIIGNNHLLLRIGYDTEVGLQFIDWMLELMENVYNTVPFETLDSANQVYTMKQVLILTRMCKYGEANCISKSKELFAAYRDSGSKVPKNLRTIVYCNALRHSDNITRDFNFLWEKFQETKLMSELYTMYAGFGCAEDTELLVWYLDQTINATSGIRVQDFSTVWSYVYSSSKVGTNAAIEYIKRNYATLTESYSSVGSLISSIAGYIYEEDQLTLLEELAAIEGISVSHVTTINTSIETAGSNIEWADTVRADVVSYLSEQAGSDDSDASTAATTTNTLITVAILMLLQTLWL